jgi:hypothetical protein
MNTDTGVAGTEGAWNASFLNDERHSLLLGGSSIGVASYPRFVTKPTGDMIMTFRTAAAATAT